METAPFGALHVQTRTSVCELSPAADDECVAPLGKVAASFLIEEPALEV